MLKYILLQNEMEHLKENHGTLCKTSGADRT